MTYTPANYYPTRVRALRCIVIHTMEAPEGPQTAENIAAYFASGNVVASAHACIDQDSVVVCLPPTATAFAAPGLNADGYQIEHAGYASQDATGWADQASMSMLALSAAHAREIADAYGIPLRHLTDAELAAGQAGFVGHDQASRVYQLSDHWDPGTSFPWDQYMAMVNGGASAPSSTPISTNNTEGDPTMHLVRMNYGGKYIYAEIHLSGLGGARSFYQEEADMLYPVTGVRPVSVDQFNWLVRRAWEIHNETMRCLGVAVSTSVEDAVRKTMSILPKETAK